jgi:hypothetical protein
MFRPAEGRFCINNPVLLEKGAQKLCEGLFVFQLQAYSRKRELIVSEGPTKSIDKLAAENPA